MRWNWVDDLLALIIWADLMWLLCWGILRYAGY